MDLKRAGQYGDGTECRQAQQRPLVPMPGILAGHQVVLRNDLWCSRQIPVTVKADERLEDQQGEEQQRTRSSQQPRSDAAGRPSRTRATPDRIQGGRGHHKERPQDEGGRAGERQPEATLSVGDDAFVAHAEPLESEFGQGNVVTVVEPHDDDRERDQDAQRRLHSDRKAEDLRTQGTTGTESR